MEKTHPVPRLTALYGDADLIYTYSGISMQSHEWSPLLIEIRNYIQSLTGYLFNSVLLNYYRDGKDSNGWHQDNEPELGLNPVIASLSFGDTRTFKLKHLTKEIPVIDIPLSSGSLLLMAGSTQHCWKHQIPKTTKPLSGRINLTFRRII